MIDCAAQPSYKSPSSILVVGAGVFGLSTTLALLESPIYSQTRVTLVDPDLPPTKHQSERDHHTHKPSSQASSIDSSRIIRPDYANPAYSRLAAEAQEAWRNGFGGQDVYHESGLVVVAGKGGSQYVEAACRNVENIPTHDGASADREVKRAKDVETLGSTQEIRKAAGLTARSQRDDEEVESEVLGCTGYINYTSGWANAEGAIRNTMQRLLRYGHTSRLSLEGGRVKQLLFSPSDPDKNDSTKPTVTGVVLTDSSELEADLTILATGAWTPSLLDLHGRLQATGQVVAYLPLTAAEAQELQPLPVLLNLSTGYFVIPPALNASSPSTSSFSSPSLTNAAARPAKGAGEEEEEREPYTHHLKFARHAHGYLNHTPLTISTSPTTTVFTSPSLPSSAPPPPSALHAMRTFQQTLFAAPHPLSRRPFSHTRLCWYADAPKGDFLITYHPEYEGLFLCTGGSGHGFKFLPVLGAKVVDVLRGQGGEWTEAWGWRERVSEKEWRGDGSRGGGRGEVLGEAMREGVEGGDGWGRSKL
ncbi:MAG: hypothetical protein LQ344_003599 [Seirophora lacunosa]|nr:MAG: hypothetical protein LQ344_003599 [Seirophora lacunosa]